jgi:hypothetical protein
MQQPEWMAGPLAWKASRLTSTERGKRLHLAASSSGHQPRSIRPSERGSAGQRCISKRAKRVRIEDSGVGVIPWAAQRLAVVAPTHTVTGGAIVCVKVAPHAWHPQHDMTHRMKNTLAPRWLPGWVGDSTPAQTLRSHPSQSRNLSTDAIACMLPDYGLTCATPDKEGPKSFYSESAQLRPASVKVQYHAAGGLL